MLLGLYGSLFPIFLTLMLRWFVVLLLVKRLVLFVLILLLRARRVYRLLAWCRLFLMYLSLVFTVTSRALMFLLVSMWFLFILWFLTRRRSIGIVASVLAILLLLVGLKVLFLFI